MTKNSSRKRGFFASEDGLKKLDERIRQKGYTQETLAEVAKLNSPDQVKRLLNPHWGRGIQKDAIKKIAEVLGLEPTEIVHSDEWYPHSRTSRAKQTVLEASDIDWRQVCRAMLEKQQESQRLRRKATEMGFEVNVHVPLGLVERKQQQRRDGNVDPNQPYQLDQDVIAKTYQHDEFLTEVIGQKQARKNKNIAIVGEPGAGKTTLLGAIACFIQSNTEDLPICITLASLQERTIKDYLLKTLLSEAMGLVNPEVVVTPEIENELIKQFRKGGVWLLLDGVDEMGADSPVQALATIQKQLTDWLGQTRVVLTCRVNVWDVSVNNILTGFDTYRTQEFTHKQIDRFIQDWFACAGKLDRGEQLQTKLKETGRERIRELVKHPLRLALLCQSFSVDKQGELPETKAALYQRFTRYFYEWKQNLHPKDLINQDELKGELHQALGKLALAGINSKARFRLRQSLARQEMGEQLFKLACELGWLNLIDRQAKTDEPVYAFFHANFQEYFAALVIDDWDYFLPRAHDNHNPKPVRDAYRIFEPQWKEVFLLWLEREDLPEQEKEEFIKALVEFQDGCQNFYHYQAYFIAAFGVANLEKCSYIDEILTQLFEWGFASLNVEKKKSQISLNWQKPLSDFLAVVARAALRETERSRTIELLTERLNIYRNIWKVDPELLATYHQGQIDTCSQNELNDYARELRVLIAHNLGKIDAENSEAISTLKEEIDTLLEELLNVEGTSLENLSVRNLKKAIFCMITACKLFEINPGNSNAINALNTLINYILGKTLELNKEDIIYLTDLIPLMNLSLIEPHGWRYLWSPVLINPANRHTGQSDNTDPEQLIVKMNFQMVLSDAPQQIVLEGVTNQTSVTDILRTSNNKYILCLTLFKLVNEFLESVAGDADFADALIYLLRTYQDEDIRLQATYSLKAILQRSLFPVVVAALKNCLQDLCCQNDVALYRLCDGVIWHCAQNMTYPDFYRAWHGEPSSVQPLKDQFADIASQRQPTYKTYPIVINAQALEGETDTSAIAQALSNRIYRFVFPDDVEIPPEVSNAYQLERSLLQLKKQLQKQNLVLILDKCEPNQGLITFCRKLTDVLHIAWITNQPLEPPLKGFPPEQANLLSAIQSWIDEIG